MAIFTYKAIDKFGKEMASEIEVTGYDEAIKKIRGLGYFPIEVKAKKSRRRTGRTISTLSPIAKGEPQTTVRMPLFGIGAISAKEVTLFTRQLATLIGAGLPLVRSLNILRDQTKHNAFKEVIDSLAQQVETGSTFSDSLLRYPTIFSLLFVNTIKAGEAGGVLEIVLTRLADFREKSERLRSRIRTALIYPILVITVAMTVLTFLIIFVIPKFMELYEEIGSELPLPTLILLKISYFLQHRWIIGILFLVVLIISCKMLVKVPKIRYYLDVITLRFPVFGVLVQKVSIARFSRTLGTLIASGVPILQALMITKDTAGNEVIAQSITKVHDSIREGESIASPLAKTRIFPLMVVNMINVGEETGSLDQMLNKIADTYEEEVDVTVSTLTAFLEPMLIVIMGVIVASIVIAMFLPLVKLLTALSE
jgi:type IV pilus assembly protein PilC